MPGFSAQLIANHMKLYQGYVNNTNALSEKLAAMLSDGKEKTAEYAELKRRFGWEFNGMRLHELYFGNMASGGGPLQNTEVHKRIQENCGTFEAWKKDFIATGSMRGVGWVILYQDNESGRLFNTWINEHDGGHLAGGTPLLVLDVFEHAYITDYQLERAKYIEAFFNVVDWDAVARRCSK
ncbi:MAG: Fe-Mn family superoxide dismutase [Elusimicrobia bacterium]|nr:Fe-Mn family superoxide dismutase [Elusimicrobiota bacterium]